MIVETCYQIKMTVFNLETYNIFNLNTGKGKSIMNKLESLIALKKHILNMKYMFSDKQEKDNVIEHNFIKGIKYEDINLYMLDKQIEEEQKKEFERRVNQEV